MPKNANKKSNDAVFETILREFRNSEREVQGEGLVIRPQTVLETSTGIISIDHVERQSFEVAIQGSASDAFGDRYPSVLTVKFVNGALERAEIEVAEPQPNAARRLGDGLRWRQIPIEDHFSLKEVQSICQQFAGYTQDNFLAEAEASALFDAISQASRHGDSSRSANVKSAARQ